MAVKVRDAGSSAKRFAQRASAAVGDYKSGVASAGAAWEANTASAAENYNLGVQQAIGRGAFEKGVKNAGADYYQQRAATLGGDRFVTGVQAGAGNWQEGSQKFLDVIARLNLTPRGPKGDPRNFQRAQDVATALRRAKTGEAS